MPLFSYAAEYAKKDVVSADVLKLLPVLPKPNGMIYLKNSVDMSLKRYLRRQESTGRRPDAKVNRQRFEIAGEICEGIWDFFPEDKKFLVAGESEMTEVVLEEITRQIMVWLNMEMENVDHEIS
jgi:thymidylate kinase